ncbi:hypothetical protein D3C87_1759270 [compost metagenome]
MTHLTRDGELVGHIPACPDAEHVTRRFREFIACIAGIAGNLVDFGLQHAGTCLQRHIVENLIVGADFQTIGMRFLRIDGVGLSNA